MRNIFLTIVLIVYSITAYTQPKVSFTFDDGNTNDIDKYSNETWNKMLLDTLMKYELQAAFFVKGKALDNKKGKQILRQWNAEGHIIANHTYSHKNYNSSTFEFYKNDFIKCDSLINDYKNFTKLYRFPYLKEGKTRAQIDTFRAFLNAQGYKNGHVTIDASDWYIDARLNKAVRADSTIRLEKFKTFYVEHLYARACYYDSLAKLLTERQISHTMLLHHNLAGALFLGALIKKFQEKGWKVINVSDAYKDPIFDIVTNTIPAGESLVWSIAMQDEKHKKNLRYPAESMKYEKEEMDKLGL